MRQFVCYNIDRKEVQSNGLTTIGLTETAKNSTLAYKIPTPKKTRHRQAPSQTRFQNGERCNFSAQTTRRCYARIPSLSTSRIGLPYPTSYRLHRLYKWVRKQKIGVLTHGDRCHKKSKQVKKKICSTAYTIIEKHFPRPFKELHKNKAKSAKGIKLKCFRM